MPRGARRLPDECVRLLGESDLILHAGDVTTAAVLDELRMLGRVEAVHGNADEPALRQALPERLVVPAGPARIGMLHDAGPRAGRHARLVAAFPGCDAVVYGHSHLPEATRVGDTWVVNPGSPTERRRGPYRSLALLRVGDDGICAEIVPLA
jgi:putative phosphoesterase